VFDSLFNHFHKKKQDKLEALIYSTGLIMKKDRATPLCYVNINDQLPLSTPAVGYGKAVELTIAGDTRDRSFEQDLITSMALESDGSIVCFGDAYVFRKTAGYRLKTYNSSILNFNPSSEQNRVFYNPLNEVRFSVDSGVYDAKSIASVVRTVKSQRDQSIYNYAEALLSALIVHTLKNEDDKTLSFILSKLEGLSEKDDMVSYLSCGCPPAGTGKTYTSDISPKAHVHAFQTAKVILSLTADDYKYTLAIIKKALSCFSNPVISKNSSASDFRLEDLLSSENPVSLYVCTNQIESAYPLLYILASQIFDCLSHMKLKTNYQSDVRVPLSIMLNRLDYADIDVNNKKINIAVKQGFAVSMINNTLNTSMKSEKSQWLNVFYKRSTSPALDQFLRKAYSFTGQLLRSDVLVINDGADNRCAVISFADIQMASRYKAAISEIAPTRSSFIRNREFADYPVDLFEPLRSLESDNFATDASKDQTVDSESDNSLQEPVKNEFVDEQTEDSTETRDDEVLDATEEIEEDEVFEQPDEFADFAADEDESIDERCDRLMSIADAIDSAKDADMDDTQEEDDRPVEQEIEEIEEGKEDDVLAASSEASSTKVSDITSSGESVEQSVVKSEDDAYDQVIKATVRRPKRKRNHFSS